MGQSITRRNLLRTAFVSAALIGLGSEAAHAADGAADRDRRLRLALLHIAPGAGSLDANRALVDAGLAAAARAGADTLITPELAVSGYGFRSVIGLDWIPVMPDPWTRGFGRRAGRLGITPILGTPEREAGTGTLRNSLLVLDEDGEVSGRHWKVAVIDAPIENWATPGSTCTPVDVRGIPTGLLICADAYTPTLAGQARQEGARFLLSGAAWMPGAMGPDGCWEARSRETGLSLVVANRTGVEHGSDFRRARSVGVSHGERRFSRWSPASHLAVVDLLGERLRPVLRAWEPLV